MADERARLIERGRRARQLVNNEDFQGALEELRQELYQDFCQSPLEHIQGHWAVAKAVDRVEMKLRTWMAEARVEEERNEREKNGLSRRN